MNFKVLYKSGFGYFKSLQIMELPNEALYKLLQPKDTFIYGGYPLAFPPKEFYCHAMQ